MHSCNKMVPGGDNVIYALNVVARAGLIKCILLSADTA
jgi:hypothetical protein